MVCHKIHHHVRQKQKQRVFLASHGSRTELCPALCGYNNIVFFF
jgi:hypothetical protein